jgi:hypothetical protein
VLYAEPLYAVNTFEAYHLFFRKVNFPLQKNVGKPTMICYGKTESVSLLLNPPVARK